MSAYQKVLKAVARSLELEQLVVFRLEDGGSGAVLSQVSDLTLHPIAEHTMAELALTESSLTKALKAGTCLTFTHTLAAGGRFALDAKNVSIGLDGSNNGKELLVPIFDNSVQPALMIGALAVSVKKSEGGNGASSKTNYKDLLPQISELAALLAPHLGSTGRNSEQAVQLGLERWMRQTICRLFASLDRDYMLQGLVDSLGRAFRPSRCLVVRQIGTALTGVQSQVSHEYEEPDLSPLGLGRTGQFPPFAMSLFTQRCTGYSDIAELAAAYEFTEKETDLLLDNGIVSLAGAPLTNQGGLYGVVLLVHNTRRNWSKVELECIETVVNQASIALSHCLNQHELKDQLFHSSLMGNLTEQLTYALETAVRLPKASAKAAEERPMFESPESASLSNREMEVLRLIASGYANKEIAQRLFLTESTVELHASRIRKKLKLKSRTALVKYACDNGLV
ncbi:MAG: GAF domain-containing protein [Candidatus Obscuribacter sp.]|nr:GAF domain-containing protein [Candidatus Obscuribacter sp.]